MVEAGVARLMAQRAACCETPNVPEKVGLMVNTVCGSLMSTSPVSIFPGVELLAGTSAVKRPTIAIGPGVTPLKFPVAPETPITQFAPSGPAPDKVLFAQVAVVCSSICPEPRTPVASNSTMRPCAPVESIEKSYVGVPTREEKTSCPRLSFVSVKVPVNALFDGPFWIESTSSNPPEILLTPSAAKLPATIYGPAALNPLNSNA